MQVYKKNSIPQFFYKEQERISGQAGQTGFRCPLHCRSHPPKPAAPSNGSAAPNARAKIAVKLYRGREFLRHLRKVGAAK